MEGVGRKREGTVVRAAVLRLIAVVGFGIGVTRCIYGLEARKKRGEFLNVVNEA